MVFIAWFKELSKESVGIAGGKGANLGEMFNARLPVPPGFVITAQAYKQFIESTGIKDKIFSILKSIDVNDTEELQKAAQEIQSIIRSVEIPSNMAEQITEAYHSLSMPPRPSAEQAIQTHEAFVAVRSSATAEDLPEASFAGQQATFLNIKGAEELLNAVRACWASLFTARAIFYRERNRFPHERVLIAVVVQKMVNSDKSGVMFSINPSTNNVREVVIEAAFGLGEAVVSGAVNPDLYIVDKDTLEIKKSEIKEQGFMLIRDPETGKTIKKKLSPEKEAAQVLTDKEIVELARLAKKIEAHYGIPQDIEWAIEAGNIYIVQSRAVTTIKKPLIPLPKKKAIALVSGETASAGIAAGIVRIVHTAAELDKVQQGDILVTEMTNPDMVPAMQRAAAIVTDAGGLTCHAAIVSREMGIPCIVGTENATSVLKEGQLVTVDATHGQVFEGRVEELLEVKEKKKEEVIAVPKIVTATEVKVNVDLPELAEKAKAAGADGVGLLRLEFLIAKGGVHPAQYIRENRDKDYTNLIVAGIEPIAKAFYPKPVWVRCSDLRTDEYTELKGAEQEPKEDNPMLGWHAIRRLLDEPRILKAEFAAIKRLHENGLTNVGIMLPFVIRVREVRKAKEIMADIGLEPCKDVEFGVMVETPASCEIIEELCNEGINFISFGTNDLTQLTLGIDRNNERIAKLFDEMHPAVLRQLERVINVCKANDVKTSICGQAGSRPEMAAYLVKLGIDSISANIDAVQMIRETVARTERKLLLEAERAELKK